MLQLIKNNKTSKKNILKLNRSKKKGGTISNKSTRKSGTSITVEQNRIVKIKIKLEEFKKCLNNLLNELDNIII